MKTLNTSIIFDNSKSLLYDLYAARMEQNATKAILELKTYHLPPLFAIPPAIKNKIPLRPEIELFNEQELQVQNKSECPSCYQTRPLYGSATHMCLECWSTHISSLWREFPIKVISFTQILTSRSYIPSHLQYLLDEPWLTKLYATTLRELIQLSRAALRDFPTTKKEVVDSWTTPKKSFLIQELGCTSCQYIPDFKEVGWLWSADFSDWTNGFCPLCSDVDTSPNTVWGMEPPAYRSWQESYSTTRKLHRTIERYGSLSLLLVNPAAMWANYVCKVVPHTTLRRLSNTLDGPLSRLPIGSIYQAKTTALSLSELGINLEDIL